MIEVFQGDITKLDVDPATRKRFAEADAIVNPPSLKLWRAGAANSTLLGGGGVNGNTIHTPYALFIGCFAGLIQRSLRPFAQSLSNLSTTEDETP